MIKLCNRDFAKSIEVISRLTQESHDILWEMCERVRMDGDKEGMREQFHATTISNLPALAAGIIAVFVEDETVCEKVLREALVDSYVLSKEAASAMVLMGYNSQAVCNDEKQLLIDLYDGSRVGIALEVLTSVIQEKLDNTDIDLTDIDFNNFNYEVAIEGMHSKYRELTSFHK